MTLPPEVLKLLGDDATPERAIEMLSDCFGMHERHVLGGGDVSDEPLLCWQEALAAAAIRECEAWRAHRGNKVDNQTYAALGAAEVAYNKLRNWSKP